MEFKTFDTVDKWVEEHYKVCKTHATAGEQFEYTFLPTAIGMFQEVKCLCCGRKFEDDDV